MAAYICRLLVVWLAAAPLLMGPGASQTAPLAADWANRQLVVGTKEAPPFAIRAKDGTWHGISIELWRHVADEMRLGYRFSEEATVEGLVEGVAAGRFDAAVAAITPTAARERTADFTQAYYMSGLGIAVRIEHDAGWRPVARAIFSFGFAQAVLALVGLALSVGIIIWWFERDRNSEFGGGIAKGLASGALWSASAMTQRATGNLQPQSLPGRIVAVFWMVVSIIAIAVFTAGITSALTTKQLRGAVNGVSDLSLVRVGHVSGTSSADTLTRLRVDHRGYGTLEIGLKALQEGKIDALVHDRPILTWVVRDGFSSSIDVLSTTFDSQSYAIAVSDGSSIRKPLNAALLNATHGDWWDRLLFQYLGAKS